MARQRGLLKIEGTLDELTFYKSSVDGHLVRTKGGVSGERIATDPVFARTRENGLEFANAAKAGKLLRDTVRVMMQTASDSRVTSRLTKLMTEIKNYDQTSSRGGRNVGVALAQAAAKDRLNGFEFNSKSIFAAVVYAQNTIDMITGDADFPALTPINDIAFPEGATHFSISGAFVGINFVTGASMISYSNKVNLPLDGTTSNVTLSAAPPTAVYTTRFYLLQVEFFQEVNGVQYTLKNGAYNALAIAKVQ